MRIVQEDPKLGVTKVVWRFDEEPDPFTPPQVEAEITEQASRQIFEQAPEPAVSAAVETPGQEAPSEDLRSASPVPPEHLEDLRQQLRFLQQVIENQNQQLKTKDELIRNFQVLLKSEQEQVMHLEARRSEQASAGEPNSPQGNWFQSWFSRLMKQ